MQEVNIDGALDYLIDEIIGLEDKSKSLTALQITLTEPQELSLPQLAFLNSCKTEDNQTLTPMSIAILEMLKHPRPQSIEMFNLVRNDAGAGNHYPYVTAKEVKDYISSKLENSAADLIRAGTTPAPISSVSIVSTESAKLYIAETVKGLDKFREKLNNLASDNKDDASKLAILSGILLGIAISPLLLTLYPSPKQNEALKELMNEFRKLPIDDQATFTSRKANLLHYAAAYGKIKAAELSKQKEKLVERYLKAFGMEKETPAR